MPGPRRPGLPVRTGLLLQPPRGPRCCPGTPPGTTPDPHTADPVSASPLRRTVDLMANRRHGEPQAVTTLTRSQACRLDPCRRSTGAGVSHIRWHRTPLQPAALLI